MEFRNISCKSEQANHISNFMIFFGIQTAVVLYAKIPVHLPWYCKNNFILDIFLFGWQYSWSVFITRFNVETAVLSFTIRCFSSNNIPNTITGQSITHRCLEEEMFLTSVFYISVFHVRWSWLRGSFLINNAKMSLKF